LSPKAFNPDDLLLVTGYADIKHRLLRRLVPYAVLRLWLMPELPEVETVARQLAEHLRGRRCNGLTIHDPKLETIEVGKHAPLLIGSRCNDVYRLGKLVVLRFDTPLFVGVHLRMTGRLIWHGSRVNGYERRPRAIFAFDGGNVLFQDTRRFGVIRLVGDEAKLLCGGIDPLSRTFTSRRLASLIGSCRQEIKPWLMRQDRLAGVGNIYASEILHECGIHPLRRAHELDPEQIARLCRATRKILARAIKHCGVTFSDFQDSNGRMGSYQRYLAVYGREGEPCARCGSEILRCVQQQRSTFYCATCQC